MSKQEKKAALNKNNQTDTAEHMAAEIAVGPGKQLAEARAAMGLTQQEVADRLHLRISSIQAVESDSAEQGVSVTFTKGYVRLYARLLNLPVEPLLLAFDKLHEIEKQPAKLQSFSRRVSREAHDHRWNMVSIIVVLLVIGSVVVWWVDREGYFKDSGKNISEAFDSLISTEAEDAPEDVQTDLLSNGQDDVVKLDTGPQIPEEEVAGLEPQITRSNAANNLQNEAEQMQSNLQSGADEVEEDIGNAVTTVTKPDPIGSGRIPVPSRGDIVEGEFNDEGYRVNADGTVDVIFTFKDNCWVSVKDGNGDTMAIGVKTKGRVMSVAGVPPISVIICAPKTVDVDFGGLAIDLSGYPRSQTAKFSLPIESE